MKKYLFEGREEERIQLLDILENVMEGKGTSVIIKGETGIGKTALAEWLSIEAEKRGFTCFQGAGKSRNGSPYHPFIDAFKILRGPPESNYTLPLGISLLAKKVEKGHVFLFNEEDPNTLRNTMAKLEKMALKKPILLVIEELHMVDKPSLLAFRYISENIGELPVLLVGTYVPEEAHAFHALEETFYYLRQKDICTHIDLHPIEENDTHELLTNLLKVEPPPFFREFIHEKTEGNPLFIAETVKSMMAKGLIIPEEDRYPLPEDDIEWPSTVRYVAERKMVKLDPETKDLLQRASILGLVISYPLLSELIDEDDMKVLDMLDVAVERGIMVEEADMEGYSFKHSAFRDILYSNQFMDNKKRLHKKAAHAILRLSADSLDTYRPQLAEHYEKAGMIEEALDNYIKAAETARGEMKKIGYLRRATRLPIRTQSSREAKKELGNRLLKYGNEQKGSSRRIFLREAKEIFEKLQDKTALERCRELLGE